VEDIDYSRVPEPQVVKPNVWKPPKRVYYGKRDEDGQMEDEPALNTGKGEHVEYPRFMYARVGGKVSAALVNNDEEKDALGKELGWLA
jgi:hypothetical protein